MESLYFLFRTWFVDDYGLKRHLYVERYRGVGNNLFYHCIVDGETYIDIEMIDNNWEDVSQKNGQLARQLGTIIDSQKQ